MWLDYVKMLFVLIGICLIALVAVKMLIPRLRGMAVPASNGIHIFAKYPLEPRKTLYVVKIGKTVVLLATSGETVRFMTTLDPKDFEDNDVPAQVDTTSVSAFKRIAQSFAARHTDKSL
jgi:flagellar biogenesis protein FliO